MFFAPTRFMRILTAINHLFCFGGGHLREPARLAGFSQKRGESLDRPDRLGKPLFFFRLFAPADAHEDAARFRCRFRVNWSCHHPHAGQTILNAAGPHRNDSRPTLPTWFRTPLSLPLAVPTRPGLIPWPTPWPPSANSASPPQPITRHPGPAANGCEVPTFVNEFWTARQRQASSLHEISYRACFKPQLPRFFIERLTQPGDCRLRSLHGPRHHPAGSRPAGPRALRQRHQPAQHRPDPPAPDSAHAGSRSRRGSGRSISMHARRTSPTTCWSSITPTRCARISSLKNYLLDQRTPGKLRCRG